MGVRGSKEPYKLSKVPSPRSFQEWQVNTAMWMVQTALGRTSESDGTVSLALKGCGMARSTLEEKMITALLYLSIFVKLRNVRPVEGYSKVRDEANSTGVRNSSSDPYRHRLQEPDELATVTTREQVPDLVTSKNSMHQSTDLANGR